MVYKCTDIMAAFISDDFNLSFILLGHEVGILSTLEIATVGNKMWDKFTNE